MVEQASYRFSQLVFSGGGTRCFWHGGFMAAVAKPLKLRPARVSGVSGGALAAACYLGNREEKGFEVMASAFDDLDSNISLHKIDNTDGLTPHQRIYREVVTETFDQEAIEAIAEGPEFEVLMANPPSRLAPRLSTLPVMLAYMAELQVRSTPHMTWPERLGVKRCLADGRQAARDGLLVDLICNAAVIPPVFNVQQWEGNHVIDGGMASKAPFPSDDGGATLILLTRHFRNLPQDERRLYVTPSRETPADKIDFTDRSKIERTWALGRQDGKAFLQRHDIASGLQ